MRGLSRRGKVYWMDYRVNGKRYRESTGTTLRREAEYIYACRKKEAKEGKIPEIKKIKAYTLVQLGEDYLNWAKPQRCASNKKDYLRYMIQEFGDLDLRDLSTLAVEKFQSKHLKTHAPATTNRLLSCLKHMIAKAVDWDMATEETLKNVRKVKKLKENNKRLRYLNIEEIPILLECCTSHLKPIVTVALHTGMRRGEILNLQWHQVDLRHGFILLDKTKNGERREIPIDETLRTMFNKMPHSIESIYVFTDRDGNPYKRIKTSFGTALKKAEIHNFRFHDIRHTFASHLVMQGVDLTSVKELLGHKSITTTMRYAHLAPGHKRKAVNILDKAFTNNDECVQIVTKMHQNTSKQVAISH